MGRGAARHSQVSLVRSWLVVVGQMFLVGSGLVVSWALVLTVAAVPALTAGGICFLLLNDLSGDAGVSSLASVIVGGAALVSMVMLVIRTPIGQRLRIGPER